MSKDNVLNKLFEINSNLEFSKSPNIEMGSTLDMRGNYTIEVAPEERSDRIKQSREKAQYKEDALRKSWNISGPKQCTISERLKESVKAEKQLTDEEMEVIRIRNRQKRKELLSEKMKEPKSEAKKPVNRHEFLVVLKEKLEIINKYKNEKKNTEIVKEELNLSKWQRTKLEARGWLRSWAHKIIRLLEKI